MPFQLRMSQGLPTTSERQGLRLGSRALVPCPCPPLHSPRKSCWRQFRKGSRWALHPRLVRAAPVGGMEN